jgi:crotonobetaine/carnitine-CoA ligase
MSQLLIDLVGRDRATVPELLSARVERTPDSPFVIWEDRTWSYAAAYEEILAAAAAVEELVSGAPDARVASYLENRPEAMWAWLGTLVAGVIFVPLNRAQRGAVLADMVRRSGADAVITDPTGSGELEACLGRASDTAVVTLNSLAYRPRAGSRPSMRVAAQPGDVAELMYTSGSTGPAKAVRIPHNQLCRGGARFAECVQMSPRDRWHGWLPLYHIFAQLHMTMATIVSGASVALIGRFSLSKFWSQVGSLGTTIFGGFGNLAHMLWALPEDATDADNPTRVVVIAQARPDLIRPFEERFGLWVVDTFGMTEAGPVTLPREYGRLPVGACGVPTDDFEVAILDEDGNHVAPGEKGEIAIRPRVPDVMFHGYDGDPEATVAAWRNLWFHTGDAGRRDADGTTYFVDRLKHRIKRRGENVSPYDVELIAGSHPAVARSAVVGVPSADGDEEVKLIVTPRKGARLLPDQIHAYCQAAMARFMVPRYIEVRDDLPYSVLGKVDKAALKAHSAVTWDARAGDDA